jgi:hypothetical protein
MADCDPKESKRVVFSRQELRGVRRLMGAVAVPEDLL